MRRGGGINTSPLLIAAMAGCLDGVEWFLTDIPLRHYLDFAQSKAARGDVRVKHLASSPGGIAGAITKWLDDQSKLPCHELLIFTSGRDPDNNLGDLVLHAAVMAPPSKKATKLVSYLVQSQPALLEAKSVGQMTPLQAACLLGRLDVIEILVKAGAQQSTKETGWRNLLHSALHFNPTAKKLRSLLKLLDGDLVVRMLRERSSLSQLGRTPLHCWIDSASSASRTYKTNDEVLEVLKLLLETSPEASKRALHMLDAAGDTPLHTLIFKNTGESLSLARAIIDFDPSLLFRENAVGRTPIEVARERFIANMIQMGSSNINYWVDDSVGAWVNAPAGHFIKKKEEDEPREHEDSSNVAKMWRLCEESLVKFPTEPKRRLVSLYEANDVSKRLGEEHMRSRYHFRVRALTDSDDEKDSEAGNEKVARKKHRKGDDIVSKQIWGKSDYWKRPKTDEDDDFLSDSE